MVVRKEFKFFENENVSIMILDHGRVSEKCDYCGHPLRYHFIIDDKIESKKSRMKVGCECVKLFLKDSGASEILIERAEKIIKKQLAAMKYAERFEKLNLNNLIETYEEMCNCWKLRHTARLKTNELAREKGIDSLSYNKYKEELEKLNESSGYSTAMTNLNIAEKLWIKKYYGKYRGLSRYAYGYSKKLEFATLEEWRTKMIAFYMKPVRSPYYFG